MKILLYGGTGFIGQALAEHYLVEDPDCHVTLVGHAPNVLAPCILDDPRVEFIDAHISAHSPFDEWNTGQDIVFHLLSSTVPITSGQNYGEELQDIPMTGEMIDSCTRSGVGRFVFISSAGSVYGDIQEGAASELTPCAPLSPYAYQKLAIEELVKFFGRTRGLDYRIVRLSNPYGPRRSIVGPQGVIPIFADCIKKNQPLVIRGDGTATRDYVFLGDAVRAMRNIASDAAVHRIYNVGSGESIQLVDVVRAIETALGKESELEFVPAPSEEVSSMTLDVGRYEAEFGKIKTVSFSEGVEETVRGFWPGASVADGMDEQE